MIASKTRIHRGNDQAAEHGHGNDDAHRTHDDAAAALTLLPFGPVVTHSFFIVAAPLDFLP